MILYFTGTNNSKYIAEFIADKTGEDVFSINESIKNRTAPTISPVGRLIFVTPTYAWRIPKIVEEWIEKTTFTGKNKAWFIMDCGGEIGSASKYISALCNKKGFEYMGVFPIKMPENYTALFYVPNKEEADSIVEKAVPKMDEAVGFLKENKRFPAVRNNLYDKFMSGPVNPIFYKFFVKADKFYSTDKCISCGMCVKVCPLNNIKLTSSRPEWGKNCTHCMACIASCPTRAIEYGKKSVKRNRYICREFTKD